MEREQEKEDDDEGAIKFIKRPKYMTTNLGSQEEEEEESDLDDVEIEAEDLE